MPTKKVVYIERPATSIDAMKAFYGSLLEWSFQDWGADYTTFSKSGVDGAFHAGDENRTKAPLIIIETDNIQAVEERVQQTGGTITLPTFKFPGGRRFHFVDPRGSELAIMQLSSREAPPTLFVFPLSGSLLLLLLVSVASHVALHRLSIRTLMSWFDASSVLVGVREKSRCCYLSAGV